MGALPPYHIHRGRWAVLDALIERGTLREKFSDNPKFNIIQLEGKTWAIELACAVMSLAAVGAGSATACQYFRLRVHFGQASDKS